MRNLLAIATLITGTLFVVSCSDDDAPVDLDAPVVTAPSASSAQVGTDVTIDFPYTAAAGFTSSALSGVTGGTATVTTDGTAGATSGTITVTFSATTVGAGSVTLTVTDAEGDTGNATGVVTISASDVPEIEDIPATASIEAEMELSVDATINMEDLPGTLNITKNGDAFGTEIAITTDGQTVTFAYTPTIDEANTNLTFVFTAEDSDGDTDEVTHVLTVTAPDFPTVVVDENISTDVTWTAGNIYELATRVTVVSGGSLTIEPGTVIKGQLGQGEASTALLVARGGSINAVGTADDPIIFTSVTDELIPGQIVSPNLEGDVTGLWGGVIILGNDLISVSAGTENQIDGIPPSDTNGLYGGSDDTDDSGDFSYVSIRHAGTDIGDGDEINGLTLGAVGAATTISWVEIVANKDDGIEWFGGSVDMTGALVWNNGDDALDSDEAWNGDLTNFLVVNPGKSAFELDGPEGAYINAAKPNHTFSDGLVYIPSAADWTLDVDENSNVNLSDIYFYGYPTTDPAGTQDYAAMIAFANSTSSLTSCEYTFPAGVTYTEADVFAGIPDAELTAVDANANMVGPTDATGFEWTFAYQSGALSSIGL